MQDSHAQSQKRYVIVRDAGAAEAPPPWNEEALPLSGVLLVIIEGPALAKALFSGYHPVKQPRRLYERRTDCGVGRPEQVKEDEVFYGVELGIHEG